MSLEMCQNALRFVTDVVLNIQVHSHFHSRGRTHDAGSVTRIAFKYKLTGFRINLFRNDFSVYYFVFVYS